MNHDGYLLLHRLFIIAAIVCFIVEAAPAYPGKRIQWQWVAFALLTAALGLPLVP